MRRGIDVVLSVLVLLLVLGSLVVISGSAVGKPWLAATVPTGSMMPVLQPGDLITVVPCGEALRSERLSSFKRKVARFGLCTAS
jgi:signal peptidase I